MANLKCKPLMVVAPYSSTVLEYSIVDWTNAKLLHFDMLTRKVMMVSDNHHPRSAVE